MARQHAVHQDMVPQYRLRHCMVRQSNASELLLRQRIAASKMHQCSDILDVPINFDLVQISHYEMD